MRKSHPRRFGLAYADMDPRTGTSSEDVKVVLFGSRARGDYFETSDMDIGILPKGEMNKNKVALFREKIENSNIPYKVDVVDLSQASREFTDKAIKEGLVIWKN